MNSWVGAPDDVRTGDDAINALNTKNDAQYWDAEKGVVRVPKERWLEAQLFESTGWLKHWSYAASDRNHEHAAGFNNYVDLPLNLGDAIEVGCGPFTQLATIIDKRVVESVTLADPLLNQYKVMPNCPYASGTYYGYQPTLLSCMAEELDFHRQFDTVVCINVLEHVMDAELVLDRMFDMLRVGGWIVFGERWNDEYDPKENFDIGHPIIVRKSIIHAFKDKFMPVYCNGIYYIGRKYETGPDSRE